MNEDHNGIKVLGIVFPRLQHTLRVQVVQSS